MISVLKWFVSISLCTLALGCGQGFEGKIRPGTLTSSDCCAGRTSSQRTALLDNPGFESDLTGWDDWGNSSVLNSGAHSGAKALRIAGGTGGRGQEVIYRLQAGGKYLLKGFARVANTSDIVYLGVKFSDNTNALIDQQQVRVTGVNFSEYSVEFTVPLSVSSAQVFAYKQNATATSADFDDFSLVMAGAPVNAPMQPPISNPANAQPTGPAAAAWSLVMSDEFTSTTLNSSTWNSGFWFNYTINNELQAYRPENVKLNGSGLSLLAEKRSTLTTWGDPMNYASAALTTRGKFTFTFGAIEARLRVPKGKGYYPQFWMLPADKRSPPEIDILQVNGADSTLAHFNYAWMDDNGIPRGQPMTASRGDLSAAYHVYTVEWEPDSISYYIDGTLAGRYVGAFVLRDPAYVILNLAIGGDVPGSPLDTTTFPQSMDVDYVRVWQKPL